MASEMGLYGVANQALHCMCKFGVIGFSQSLHHELRVDNIKVTCICPGPTNTWNDPDPSRLLRPEDVAEAILFALTTHANAVVNEIVMRPLRGSPL
jgi:short-subunit dehydrogenase